MNITMGTAESRFADLVWANAPIPSGQLVKLCQTEFEWKKSTTYTVLRRLCDRGLFQNTDGVVTALISREDYYADQSHQFVEESFQGSLPGFLAAFTKRKQLTDKEIDALEALIREQRGT